MIEDTLAFHAAEHRLRGNVGALARTRDSCIRADVMRPSFSMSLPALLLLAVAVALTAFGWWGQNTVAGRQRYDEMAGMIPGAAYWVGLGLGVIAVIWLCIAAWRTRG